MRQFLCFTLLCTALNLSAQQSAVLDSYIQAGLNGNLALQGHALDIDKSREALRQAKALFMPSLTFNASYTLAAGGRKIDFPIGDLMNPVYTNLNQLNEVLMPGAPMYPLLENQQINFLPNNFQETKVKFAYPLYNSDIRYNKLIQEHLVQSKTASKAAYEQSLRFEITEAYLQYLKALEAEKIWVNSRSVLVELRRFNESLVKNNVATRDVVATADYELSKADQEIGTYRQLQASAQAYFNFLLNRDLQEQVVADTTLLNMAPPAFNRNDLIAQAMTNRQEFAALRAGQDAAVTAVKLNETNRKLPDLYVGGEAGFQGFGYQLLDDQAYVLAQVGLSYDLYDGGKNKSKIQEAKIEADKVRNQMAQVQQQIALQITVAYNELETAKINWQTTQSGLAAAQETFRIINNKYRAGQALLLEYTEAQNRVTTARMRALLAWIDVVSRTAALKKAAGYQ